MYTILCDKNVTKNCIIQNVMIFNILFFFSGLVHYIWQKYHEKWCASVVSVVSESKIRLKIVKNSCYRCADISRDLRKKHDFSHVRHGPLWWLPWFVQIRAISRWKNREISDMSKFGGGQTIPRYFIHRTLDELVVPSQNCGVRVHIHVLQMPT